MTHFFPFLFSSFFLCREETSQPNEKLRVKKIKPPAPIITQPNHSLNGNTSNSYSYTSTTPTHINAETSPHGLPQSYQYGYNHIVYSPHNSEMLTVSSYPPVAYSSVMYSSTTSQQSHFHFPLQYSHQPPSPQMATHQTMVHPSSPHHFTYDFPQFLHQHHHNLHSPHHSPHNQNLTHHTFSHTPISMSVPHSVPMPMPTTQDYQRSINYSSQSSASLHQQQLPQYQQQYNQQQQQKQQHHEAVNATPPKQQSTARKAAKLASKVFFPETNNEPQNLYQKYYNESQSFILSSQTRSSSATTRSNRNRKNHQNKSFKPHPPQVSVSVPDIKQEIFPENNTDEGEEALVDFQSIFGRILQMSQDQAGCKILQKIVKRGSQEDLEMIYQEVAGSLGAILNDVFGNYFFQCLYEQANSELKHKIVGSVLCHLLEGAKNCYGTRSVQYLIKNSSEDLELYTQLKSQLLPNLHQLCTDRYGNHCIKQLLMSGNYEMNLDIIEFLKSRWYEFCIHQYCGSTIQTCLKHFATQTIDLATHIIGNIIDFIQV